jgi:hypothetical protein
MEMAYRYAILDPRATDAARAHNDAVFASGPVYGLEVTLPALAERCAANLDPQHLGGDAGTAAIEAALTWPLPPDGATLATIRPDMDSVGAMAVLAIRRRQEPELDLRLREDVDNPESSWGAALHWRPAHRLRAIALADREASGPWPGLRLTVDVGDLVSPTTALNAVAMDHTMDLPHRVDVLCEWLERGTFAGEDARRASAELEAKEALATLQIDIHGDSLVGVTGAHRLAFAVGYRRGAVVVATNPEFRWQGGPAHRKHTIGRWNTTVEVYWDEMLAELRRREPGWGGSPSIVGSPQGVGSVLTTAEVVDIVRRYRRLAVAEERIVAAGRAHLEAHPASWADFDRRTSASLAPRPGWRWTRRWRPPTTWATG